MKDMTSDDTYLCEESFAEKFIAISGKDLQMFTTLEGQ